MIHDEPMSPEAVILDGLFDTELLFRHLSDTDDGLRLSTNLPYSHGLSDEALSDLLHSMQASGLVETFHRSEDGVIRPEDVGPWYRLTAEGGRRWEEWRRPVWHRYCTDGYIYTPDFDELHEMEVICLDPDIGQAFLETASIAGFHDIDLSTTKAEHLAGTEQPIPWKHLGDLWRVSAIMRSDDSTRGDWDLYESRRIWWRTVPELLKLNTKKGANP